MIGVENDRDSVKSGDFVNMLGSRNTSGNGSLVIGVVSGLSGNEGTASLGEGDDDRSTVLLGGLHAGIDGGSSNNVDSRNGESNLLGVVEKVDKGLSGDNTRLDGSRQLGESLKNNDELTEIKYQNVTKESILFHSKWLLYYNI